MPNSEPMSPNFVVEYSDGSFFCRKPAPTTPKPNQILARFDGPATGRGSADRFWLVVVGETPALVWRQPLMVACLLACLPLDAAVGVAFLRVARTVVGGEAGAKRGASGVPGTFSTASAGVIGRVWAASSTTWSSMSVSASSSSIEMAGTSGLATGKRSLGLTLARVSLLTGASTALSKPPSIFSEARFLKRWNCFLPRLFLVLAECTDENTNRERRLTIR